MNKYVANFEVSCMIISIGIKLKFLMNGTLTWHHARTIGWICFQNIFAFWTQIGAMYVWSLCRIILAGGFLSGLETYFLKKILLQFSGLRYSRSFETILIVQRASSRYLEQYILCAWGKSKRSFHAIFGKVPPTNST